MKNFSVVVSFLFLNGCFGGGACDGEPSPYVPDRPEQGDQSDCFSRSGEPVGLGWSMRLGHVSDDYESFEYFEDVIAIEDGFQGGSHLRLGIELNDTVYAGSLSNLEFRADDEILDAWIRYSVLLDGDEIAYVAQPFEYIYWRTFPPSEGLMTETNVQFLGAPNVDDFLNKDLQIKVSIDVCGKADFFEEEIVLQTNERIDG